MALFALMVRARDELVRFWSVPAPVRVPRDGVQPAFWYLHGR
jgi:hypothetical protein